MAYRMRKRILFHLIMLLFLILIMALVPGCFRIAPETTPPVTPEPLPTLSPAPIGGGIAPTINSTNPVMMAMGVKINVTITATFNEPMEPSTITPNTFVLQRGTTLVEGTVICTAATAAFTPSATLAYATTYTATITRGVRDLAGNVVTSNYVWSFTTEAPPDRVPPTLISTKPAKEAKGVATNSTVTGTFNKEMDPSTFTKSAFTLRQGANPISGTLTCVGAVVTFRPTTNLAYNTFYIATVTAGVKDLAGNALENEVIWSFTTAAETDTSAPSIISVSPSKSATGVQVNTTLKAAFSEAMNALSLTMATFTLSGGVGGAVTYGDNIVSFTPSANLSYATTYTATITTGVSDLTGNAMANDYAWSFTTESAPVNNGPPPVNPPNPVRMVTLTDSDLPQPPVLGMTFHFVAPEPGEYGPGKIRISYFLLKWSIWFGVSDGKLWVYNLPKRESLPQSLQGFYDYLGITENSVYTDDGRCWLTGIPPWMNISKYDPEVVKLPVLVTVESSDGQAKIYYKLSK